MSATQRRQQKGATLLEVLVAVLIFSLGILAVIGMQGTAVRAVIDAKYRSDASFIANATLARAWGDPQNLANLVETDVPIGDLPNGRRTVTINDRQVTVVITWQPPGEGTPHQFVTVGFIGFDD